MFLSTLPGAKPKFLTSDCKSEGFVIASSCSIKIGPYVNDAGYVKRVASMPAMENFFLAFSDSAKIFYQAQLLFQKSAVAIKDDFKNVNKHDGVYGCRFCSSDSFYT